MHVPFVDLKAQYASLKDELDAAILDAVGDTAFIAGAVSETSKMNLRPISASNIASGSRTVLMPSRSHSRHSASARATRSSSPRTHFLRPPRPFRTSVPRRFLSICAPNFYNIDPDQDRRRDNNKTKAIIPVHLYGLPAEMDDDMEIAKKHGPKVSRTVLKPRRDTYKGRRTGTFGDIATFSFYPGKNLGAYGDAGAIVTNNAEIAAVPR